MKITPALLILAFVAKAAVASAIYDSASPKSGIYSINETECARMKSNHVLSERAPLGCNRLKKVVFEYRPLSDKKSPQKTAVGEVIVFDAIALKVKTIFSTLYHQGFPIAKAVPLEQFNGSDNASMAANNTSSFNARLLTNGHSWSKHAYGMAIDVNPLQNPFLDVRKGVVKVLPAQAATLYLNRSEQRLGKTTRQGLAEAVKPIFMANGFLIWGGDWNVPIDYQHFEVGSGKFVRYLSSLSFGMAQKLFDQYVSDYRRCMAKQQPEPNVCAAQIIKKYDQKTTGR